jgi:hypothetical protein
MRKFLQSFALFTAFVAFTAVAANAQVSYGSEVNIPFAFQVNDRSYDAGTYIVKVNKKSFGGAILTIRAADSDDAQTVLMTDIGGSRTEDVRLVFAINEGVRRLSGVTTSSSAFAFVPAKGAGRKG